MSIRALFHVLALLAVLGLALPASADPTVESWRYVAGSGLDKHWLVCVSPDEGPGVGGACTVPAASENVTVSVVDDAFGHVSFFYEGIAAEGEACALAGTAASPAAFVLPEGCVGLSVFPAVGSLAGTITASS